MGSRRRSGPFHTINPSLSSLGPNPASLPDHQRLRTTQAWQVYTGTAPGQSHEGSLINSISPDITGVGTAHKWAGPKQTVWGISSLLRLHDRLDPCVGPAPLP